MNCNKPCSFKQCPKAPKHACGCCPFRKVVIPTVLGDDSEGSDYAPENGAYQNALVEYEANGAMYIYSSDGIFTKISMVAGGAGAATVKYVDDQDAATLASAKAYADEKDVTVAAEAADYVNGEIADLKTELEGEIADSINRLATVATSGSYNDLTDKPDIPSGLHVFHMGPASVGNTAPIYHDYERTNQVTLAQFIDAIASGPVQIYKAYDMRTFQIYYVDQMDAFIPDPPQYTGTLYVSFGLRNPYGLGVERFSWYEPDTAPTYDSYDPNQSDWNQTSPTDSSYIKNKPNLATVATSGSYNDLSNKPTIPAAQVNSDWNASSGVAQILNKPTLAAVATSGDYNDLSNKPTIPAAQVNSDWNAASGVAQILNKPSLATVATSGSYNDLANKPTIPTFTLTTTDPGEGSTLAANTFIGVYNG